MVIGDVVNKIQHSIQIAKDNFDFDYENYALHSWPQTWSDTSCGFGGVCGRAFVTAQTVVIHMRNKPVYLVFHNGMYAYSVHQPGIEFHEDMKNHKLVGKAKWNEDYYEVTE